MKKSRYSLFVALALTAIGTSACEDTVSLSVKCNDENDKIWTVPKKGEASTETITVGKCVNGTAQNVVQIKKEDIQTNVNYAVACTGNTCASDCYKLSINNSNIQKDKYDRGAFNFRCYDDKISNCVDDSDVLKPIEGDVCEKNGSNSTYTFKCKNGIVIANTGDEHRCRGGGGSPGL